MHQADDIGLCRIIGIFSRSSHIISSVIICDRFAAWPQLSSHFVQPYLNSFNLSKQSNTMIIGWNISYYNDLCSTLLWLFFMNLKRSVSNLYSQCDCFSSGWLKRDQVCQVWKSVTWGSKCCYCCIWRSPKIRFLIVLCIW